MMKFEINFCNKTSAHDSSDLPIVSGIIKNARIVEKAAQAAYVINGP